MKFIFLALLVISAATSALANDLIAFVKRDADACAVALLKNDYEGVATFTHKRVIALMGGRDEMIAALKRTMSQLHAEGFGFLDVKTGPPSEPKQVGSWLTSMVPQSVVMKVPDGRKMRKDSFLLALSEDNGERWVFLDLSTMTAEQYAQVFPELINEVPLPAKKQAVIVE